MKLYIVKYSVWNMSFSDLLPREKLSVGIDENDAIQKVRDVVESDARDFEATEVNEIFGHNIRVE